jgi:hypothetical protein
VRYANHLWLFDGRLDSHYRAYNVGTCLAGASVALRYQVLVGAIPILGCRNQGNGDSLNHFWPYEVKFLHNT